MDLIYLPEVPFDVEKFLAKVKDLLNKKASIVIAVSEESSWQTEDMYVSLEAWETMWMHLDTNSFRNSHLSGKLPGSGVRMQDKSC